MLAVVFGQMRRDLRTQRARFLLTTGGVAWGTFALTLMLAFGSGLREEMRRMMGGLGDDIVVAWPGKSGKAWQGLGLGRPMRLEESDLRILEREIPGLEAVTPEYRLMMPVRRGTATAAPHVHGVHPGYAVLRNVRAAAGGRFISPLDIENRERVAFLGDELALRLFGPGADPVGSVLQISGAEFRVIGVMSPKAQNSTYGGGMDKNKVFIPATTFRAMNGDLRFANFLYRARDPRETSGISKRVVAVLAARHRFDPTDPSILRTWDIGQSAKFNRIFADSISAFLGIMGVCMLGVSGLGLSNVLTVVVEQRTREIGIRIALGARPRVILLQILAEAALWTSAGGAAGFGAAWALCQAIERGAGNVPYMGTPTVAAGPALATALLLGMVALAAGFFPARAAARLDPVQAMKAA